MESTDTVKADKQSGIDVILTYQATSIFSSSLIVSEGLYQFVFEAEENEAIRISPEISVYFDQPVQISDFRVDDRKQEPEPLQGMWFFHDQYYCKGKTKFRIHTTHISGLKMSFRLEKIADDQFISLLNEYMMSQTAKISLLRDELREAKEQIGTLATSEQELQQFKNTFLWKVNEKWNKSWNHVFPQGSKRRLVMNLASRFAKHPIWTLSKVDGEHIRKFFAGIESGNADSLGTRLENYFGGSSVPVTRLFQFQLKDYEKLEDVPMLHVISSSKPVVSIVVPVYNQFSYTINCLKSIIKNSGSVPYEVIVADDCSTDLTAHLEEVVSGIKVIHNQKNLRFLLNCKNAAKEAKGKYILFLNNDTQVQEGWLEPLVSLIERDEMIGMVGSKLIYPDGRLQEAGGIVWKDASAANFGYLQSSDLPEFNYVKETDYISGASLMIRSELWRQLGGFDERYVPAYYEDTDLAFMVRAAGYKVMYQPLSVVIHFEGISNGTDTSSGQKAFQIKNREKFSEKWGTVLNEEQELTGHNLFMARDRSQKKKHILVVDQFVPQYDKDAGGRCAYMYLKLFAKMGLTITFIGDNFTRTEPYTTELNQLGIEVLYGDYYFSNWKKWVKSNAKNFDYVYLQRPHIGIKYIDLIKQYSQAKIIYFAHDLHHVREKREYELTHDPRLLKSAEEWKETEYKLFRDANVGHVVGTYEQGIVQAAFPDKPIRDIPLYLYDHFPENIEKNFSKRNDLLYVGGFVHRPNIDAVLWFAKEVYPHILKKFPEMIWHIVGGHVPPEISELNGRNTIVHGYVSDEELEQLYRKCRIAVAPLRYGAGVKGKVIEACYYQIPLVTTSVGAEGISREEDAMIVEEDASRMAEVINAIYDDQAYLKRLSDNGEKLIRNHYTVEEAKRIICLDIQP